MRIPGLVFSSAELAQPEAVGFYKTYIGQALFHNCDISKVTFSSVEWRRRPESGKRMVFEEEVALEEETAVALKAGKGNPNERDYGLIAELYQQLKKNYDDRKDYWTAGDFHYGEMEMKRLASRRKNRLARWLHRHLGLVAWYKYASQYGESYLRPALLLAASLLAFAVLFPLVGLRYDAGKDQRAASTPSGEPLTYWQPFLPNEGSGKRLKVEWRLFGNSCLTALEIAAFQKEPAYAPAYPGGRVLTLLEMLLTSTLFALFLLAVRRQFRR